MPVQKKKNVKKPNARLRWVITIGGTALALGIILAISGFAFAATKESHDSFCASCHTQPESTFYQRSLAAPVDLASAHTADKTRCIDCHSGEGTTSRIKAELLGAHNALAYLTHTAVQPAPLTKPIADENCLKCHAQVMTQQDMNNHFHVFLPRWQQIDPNAAGCVSCHEGHATDGRADLAYLNEARTRAVCEACHQATGEG